ncbi:zinc finger SWIM domain-containing protein 3-like [Ornithodoros turicata]|uniref:zinc finger SWIM domain-containing protein 3-like n=1 Tax=Ornithodoros turicata TaxID=34597 RepID=UPI0031388D87
MKVGAKFRTFKEFETAVECYSNEKCVQFYKRDCRSIEAGKRKVKRYLNPELGNYQVVYCCIKGGKKFKSCSKGERETSTFHDGCAAHIKCRASQDGESLEVISMCEEHNHKVSKSSCLHAEDSNGEAEVVCASILMNETKTALEWMFAQFKELNPAWEKTKSVMTNKDMLERDVIKQNFPSANVIICVFHTLRTFHREVNYTKMGITASERDCALELLQKMVMSRSDELFETLQDEFDNIVAAPVKEYYNKNWRNIKYEWCTGPHFMDSNFNNITNNRLECINGKLKSLIRTHSTLEEFIESFFSLIKALNDERDQKAMSCIYKRPTEEMSDTDALEYQKVLTPYAFNIVRKQMKTVPQKVEYGTNACTFKSSSGLITTTKDNCSCTFVAAMGLPCKHMFQVRRKQQLRLFDQALVKERWLRSYYTTHQRIFLEHSGQDETPEVTVSSTQPKPA